jgi:hypothetical protein
MNTRRESLDPFHARKSCRMNTRPLKLLIVLIAALCTAGTDIARSQDAPTIRGLVTALRLDGDRLLIGQGPTLVEARVTADNVEVLRRIDLGRHDLRAIAVYQGMTLALSEDGLTTLDANGSVIDFARGGGQRLAVKSGRVYVAALSAGVRLLKVDAAGRLTRLGTIQTPGPAADLAPEGDNWLWVAEGDSGVRLYDAANPVAVSALLWLGSLTPVTAVRVAGARLYVGHGRQVSILDTLNVHAPRVLGTFFLEGDTARVSDLLIQGNRAYAGRIDTQGADVVALDISDAKAITPVARFGDDGAGERLVLHGDDLFIGSSRLGLRRVRFGAGNPVLVAAWEPLGAVSPCPVTAPNSPRPPNLGETPGGLVTLTWTAACNPKAYELQIDGTPVAVLNAPTYTFSPQRGVITWQVTAIDETGQRAPGPVWTFESLADGWLAVPARAPQTALLYTPPLEIKLQTPGAVLAATCAALLAGLLVIVGGAWLIGMWAENRRTNRNY